MKEHGILVIHMVWMKAKMSDLMANREAQNLVIVLPFRANWLQRSITENEVLLGQYKPHCFFACKGLQVFKVDLKSKNLCCTPHNIYCIFTTIGGR